MSETTVTTSRNPVRLVQRIGELYREQGARGAVRASIEYLRLHTPLLPKPRYQHRRIDNELRWRLIRPYLESYDSLLDIGCAQGYFTTRAAAVGLESIGIDVDREAIAYARQNTDSDASFDVTEVTPETVTELPKTDVVLLLTVHHHWVDAYGFDAANEMLQTLCDAAELVVYEPPGDRYLGRDSAAIPRSPTAYYQELLHEITDGDVRVLADRTVPYTGAGRDDPFFVVDTSQFERDDRSTAVERVLQS